MTEKELRRLKRSELLEIILMLKENEKKLQEENQQLVEKLMKLSERISLRQLALSADDALGTAVSEMDEAYFAFKGAAERYRVLMEELGADAIQGKPDLYRGSVNEEE